MKTLQTSTELPKGWKWVKLGDACSVIMGQSPPSTSYNTKKEGLPFFQGKAEFTNLHPVAEKWCNAPNKVAELNDILLSVRAPVGTTNIADQKCCIGRGLAAIRFDNHKYVFYFLRSRQHELDSKGTGTTFKAISGEIVRETLFPLPPKATQQAIVSKIEELFSELDKGIEQLKTAQQQLRTYRQAVLKWTFEKIAKKENKTVEDCCSHVIDCLHSTAKFIDDGYFCVDTTCIENGKILFDKIRFVSKETYTERISRLKPEEGDILFSREGTVGTTLIVPHNTELCLGQRMMMFRLKKNISPKYYMYYLQSQLFKSQYRPLILGTTAPHLNIRDIRKFNVAICSIEEQNKIVLEIESRLSVADKMEEGITQNLQQAEALRQSILKKAFEGRLT